MGGYVLYGRVVQAKMGVVDVASFAEYHENKRSKGSMENTYRRRSSIAFQATHVSVTSHSSIA
jgi:hypothetical protein